MERNRVSLIRPLWETFKMLLTVHRPDGSPNIFLFTVARSGSTWLMEIILSQPGGKRSREPFNLLRPEVCEHLGITEWAELFNAGSEEKIVRYIEAISSGKLRDWRFRHAHPLRSNFYFLTWRTVFKIIHYGHDRINWFRDTFNGRIVYLLRHPIPVSLSRPAHLELEVLITSDYRRHFTASQLELARQIVATGDKFERGVLDWCLRNSVPLRQATPDWCIVTYEQLVLDPGPVIHHLADRLDMHNLRRMKSRLPVASGSTHLSDQATRGMLAKSRTPEVKRWLVEKWRPQVSRQQAARAREVLDEFGIDEYQVGDTLPAKRLWIA